MLLPSLGHLVEPWTGQFRTFPEPFGLLDGFMLRAFEAPKSFAVGMRADCLKPLVGLPRSLKHCRTSAPHGKRAGVERVAHTRCAALRQGL